MLIVHIFKYGKNNAPTNNKFILYGQLKNLFVGMRINGCNEFHSVPFGTGIG